MELFSIQCTTCHARLKVKDESAIGAILACPKCASMVQVVPPVGWKRAAIVASIPEMSSATISPRAVAPVLKPEKLKAAAVVPSVVPPVLPPRVPVEAVPALAPPPLLVPTGLAQAAKVPTSLPMAKVAARIKQDWLLLSGGLAAGVAIGLCAWLLAFGVADTTVATPDASSTAPVSLASLSPQAKRVETPDDSSEVEDTVEAPLAESQPEAGGETLAAHVEQAGEDSETTEVSEAQREIVKDSKDSAAATDVAVDASTAKKPPAIKLDPAPKPAVVAPADPEVESTAADEQKQPEDADAPPVSAKAVRGAAESVVSAKRVFSRTEIDERLATPLPSVQFTKVPLVQFTDFIAELTELPITLDGDALADVGRSRQTPVTVKLYNTTAADALRAALKSLGLACSVRDDGQIVITADESRRTKN